MDALVVETDAGHGLLARYYRTQTSGDLDQSIKHFERALGLCPMGHPCRAAAESNLASAKFASYQANGTYLDLPLSFNVPLICVPLVIRTDPSPNSILPLLC
jgi:hypothetical protein